MSDNPPLSPRPGGLSRDQFISRYGSVYEASPWVAEGVWPRGASGALDRVDDMRAAMRSIVDEASIEMKRRLLCAHPDLAGRAAMTGDVTDASRREQAGAGLDQCSREEFAEFHELNTAYREKFGFPFIIAVRGLDRAAILAAFRERLANTAAQEFETAIAQVHAIAGFRLMEMTSQAAADD